MPRVFVNPHVRDHIDDDDAATGRQPMRFHARLPGYGPTPLVEAPAIARRAGIASVLVKDESSRLTLPAFKVLGASWATYQLAIRRLGAEPAWQTIEELRRAFDPLRPLTLTTATDGNHGRAVARVARLFGFEARSFVPRGTAQARIDAIASEGAHVTVVDGSYDDAVRRAAAEASDRCIVVSDTSWAGYTDVAGWVTEGYSTIMHEVDDQLAATGAPPPDLVVAQIGVGSLAVAMIRHVRGRDAANTTWVASHGAEPGEASVIPRRSEESSRTRSTMIGGGNHPHARRVIGVEPDAAPCAMASVEVGRIVSVRTSETVMAGLNCGTLSMIAYPTLRDGIDAFVTVDDARALEAMRALAAEGIVSGETGASGAAGLLEALEGARNHELRGRLNITPGTRALIISTEGATDPELYARVVDANA
jgi:diaminopropionate ammonia-lyase